MNHNHRGVIEKIYEFVRELRETVTVQTEYSGLAFPAPDIAVWRTSYLAKYSAPAETVTVALEGAEPE